MIIDSHNHIGGPDKGDKASQSPEELVEAMDRAGVDKAVIFPFNEVDPGVSFSKANDRIAEAVKKYPNRLIGFARLDPHESGRSVSELERAVRALSLKGLKLHPDSQDFSPNNPIVFPIINRAAKFKIPVIFDSGGKRSPSESIGVLADMFPDVTLIMAHMRDYPACIDVCKKFDQVFLGTTGVFNVLKIRDAVKKLGAERIIAGSDSPYIPVELEIRKIELVPDLKDAEKILILGENIRNILKM